MDRFVRAYPILSNYRSDYDSDLYLNINSVGYSVIEDKNYSTHRPNGRSDYQLIYIFNGEAEFIIDNNKIKALSGACIFFYPHQMQSYNFMKSLQHESYWVHFSGSSVVEILKDLDFKNNTIMYIGKNNAVKKGFHDIINEMLLKEPGYRNTCNYLFLQILSNIKKAINMQVDGFKQYYTFTPALLEMNNNSQAPTNLEYYAKLCNMSKFAFAHTFAAFMKCSPIKYLLDIKFEKAKDMLLNSDFTINEISYLLGFSSPFYFSQQFKKREKVTPSAYRKRNVK